MKKAIYVILVMLIVAFANAQTWKTQIYSFDDKDNTKTLKMKPNMAVTIQSLKLKNDSLTHSIIYRGQFVGVDDKTMKIKPDKYSERKKFSNGIFEETVIPGTVYTLTKSADTTCALIPLSEINHLQYYNKTRHKMADFAEPVLFAALLVSLITPFICIDYKNGTFNAERYKYLGLGCTIAIAGSLGWAIIMSTSKDLQFKTDWPDKNKKVWSFESGNTSE